MKEKEQFIKKIRNSKERKIKKISKTGRIRENILRIFSAMEKTWKD